MVGEALIQHGKAGLHQMRDAQVVRYQFAQIGAALGQHAFLQMLSRLGIQLYVRLCGVDLPEVQPLIGEVGDETVGAGIGEEAVCLPFEV